MKDINFELRKRLKPAVSEYSNYIKDQQDGNILTSEYFIPSEDGMEKKEIADMRNLPDFYEEKRSEFFRDLAKWFITSGNSYNQRTIMKKNDKGRTTSYEPIIAEEAEMDQIISQYESDFSAFTGVVLDHAGSYEFDSDEYDSAFEQFFGKLYGFPAWEKHIVPITGLEVSDSITLKEELEWLDTDDLENISIEIGDIDESELAAIRSSQNRFGTSTFVRSYGFDWENVVRVEFEGEHLQVIFLSLS